MSTVADIQAMIRSLHAIGLTAPFGVYAGPDNHEPAQTVAQVAANGLGMPDRDYYSKTEERFRDTRDKYKAYITTIFTLAGASAATAAAAASVFAMETRLAEASLDNVALRDPAGHRSQDDRRRPAEDDAALRLDHATSRRQGCRRRTSTSSSRSSWPRSTTRWPMCRSPIGRRI